MTKAKKFIRASCEDDDEIKETVAFLMSAECSRQAAAQRRYEMRLRWLTVLTLRNKGHSWEYVGERIDRAPSTARRLYKQALTSFERDAKRLLSKLYPELAGKLLKETPRRFKIRADQAGRPTYLPQKTQPTGRVWTGRGSKEPDEDA